MSHIGAKGTYLIWWCLSRINLAEEQVLVRFADSVEKTMKASNTPVVKNILCARVDFSPRKICESDLADHINELTDKLEVLFGNVTTEISAVDRADTAPRNDRDHSNIPTCTKAEVLIMASESRGDSEKAENRFHKLVDAFIGEIASTVEITALASRTRMSPYQSGACSRPTSTVSSPLL